MNLQPGPSKHSFVFSNHYAAARRRPSWGLLLLLGRRRSELSSSRCSCGVAGRTSSDSLISWKTLTLSRVAAFCFEFLAAAFPAEQCFDSASRVARSGESAGKRREGLWRPSLRNKTTAEEEENRFFCTLKKDCGRQVSCIFPATATSLLERRNSVCHRHFFF